MFKNYSNIVMVENEHFYKNYCDSFIPTMKKGNRCWDGGFLCGAATCLVTTSVLPQFYKDFCTANGHGMQRARVPSSRWKEDIS